MLMLDAYWACRMLIFSHCGLKRHWSKTIWYWTLSSSFIMNHFLLAPVKPGKIYACCTRYVVDLSVSMLIYFILLSKSVMSFILQGILSGYCNFGKLAISNQALKSSYHAKIQLLLILIETLDLENLLQLLHDDIPFRFLPIVSFYIFFYWHPSS